MIVHLNETFTAKFADLVRKPNDTALKSLVADEITKAYYAGVNEGGAPDLTDEMSNEVDGLVAEQLPYLTHLSGQLAAGESFDFGSRLPLWQAAVDSAKKAGYMRAQEDTPGTWLLGNTEQHCTTCLDLNGQTHPLGWYVDQNFIPGKPGASMECHGFLCDCRIT